MEILIAVPTFETIMPETFKSIYGMRASKYGPLFDFVKGYDCAKARNEIAKEAIAGGFDYVLMIDSDVVAPNDTLERFLEYPADIVIGLCPRKNTKEKRCEIYRLGAESFRDFYTYADMPEAPRLVIKGGGLACALIKTEVFQRLKYPYFKYVIYDNDTILSEDLYFCNEARKYGMQIQCNPNVKGGHIYEVLM